MIDFGQFAHFEYLAQDLCPGGG